MSIFNDAVEDVLREEERRLFLETVEDIDRDELNEYLRKTYPQSINEMARINVKEFYGLFPVNKFEIKIWSNDHNPPHFHVLTKDGWNIQVLIEDGSILGVKNIGKDSKLYTYVEKYIGEWLNSKSVISPNDTNREFAQKEWITNNG